MRKVVVCIFALASFTHLTSCGNKNLDALATNEQIHSDVRQVFKWGTSHKEIKKSKGNENYIWEDGALTYPNETIPGIKDVDISNYICDTTYLFDEDKLYSEVYWMKPINKDNVDLIQDYNTIKEWLSHQYGEPYEYKELWREDADKESELSLKEAILASDVSLITLWSVDADTQVRLVLTCFNDTPSMFVKYNPPLIE